MSVLSKANAIIQSHLNYCKKYNAYCGRIEPNNDNNNDNNNNNNDDNNNNNNNHHHHCRHHHHINNFVIF